MMSTAACAFEVPINATHTKRCHSLAPLLCVYRFILNFTIYLLMSGACFSLNGATLPSGFIETQVTNGLSNPTAMAFAPDGRLFLCLQAGQLRVIKNDVLLPTPFLAISTDSSGERGLLGIAFDPDFHTNNFVYVYYTTGVSPKRNRVSRFVANGDLAVVNSEVVILELDNLSAATNHNGGAMHFGQDGKLYVASVNTAISKVSKCCTYLPHPGTSSHKNRSAGGSKQN